MTLLPRFCTIAAALLVLLAGCANPRKEQKGKEKESWDDSVPSWENATEEIDTSPDDTLDVSDPDDEEEE